MGTEDCGLRKMIERGEGEGEKKNRRFNFGHVCGQVAWVWKGKYRIEEALYKAVITSGAQLAKPFSTTRVRKRRKK